MIHSLVRCGVGFALAAAVSLSATAGLACPFCSAVSQTLSEEMASMDAVVLAELKELPNHAAGAAETDQVPKARFEIRQWIKGGEAQEVGQQIESLYFGESKTGDLFLIMGVDPPRLAWSTPLKVSARAVEYLKHLPQLPPKGPDRLAFFLGYLEDPDDLLTADAYDEFARAPYDVVQALRPKMDHDQVCRWIQDPEIPANRRRLYLVMLSVCGDRSDLPMLEEMLRSDDRTVKAGLDAMIACHVTLAGPEGLPLIEELFLKNRDAEYADTYAAIMALRFHGTETDNVPRPRILEALRHMLDRPQLADLVIPDLARWEDWSQMERLVALFKNADEKSSWVRVPVINYLRACPKPEAKKYIAELEKVDPAAVKRANTFFPFGGGGSNPPSEDSTSQISPAEDQQFTSTTVLRVEPTRKVPVEAVATSRLPVARGADGEEDRLPQYVNSLSLLGVMVLAGAVLMFAQWRLLTGVAE